MMLAKVCSDKNKPNGQYRIPPERQVVMDFMKDLPVRKVHLIPLFLTVRCIANISQYKMATIFIVDSYVSCNSLKGIVYLASNEWCIKYSGNTLHIQQVVVVIVNQGI